ncbi:MAG: imidazolonepropionase [Oscillospiraceae bacterium]
MKKLVIADLSQIATPVGSSAAKGADMNRLKVLGGGAIYAEDGVIRLVGTTDEVMRAAGDDAEIVDGTGKCAVPGFVDSHTHFIFGGYRPGEFISRLEGKQYLEILKEGGGIQSTVKATRDTAFETLCRLGEQRLRSMLEQGVTTVEGKSGYGLDLECELRQLRVMKTLSEYMPVDVVSTYLGGHAVPKEYKDDPDAYVAFMEEKVMPAIAAEKLAGFCDVFCEDGVFSIEQSKRILLAGKKYGMRPKIHADEIVSLGGGELAAEVGACSADHLLMVSQTGIEKLAESDTVAVLLPGTAFCMRKAYAPARKMIDSGCAVALASDFNPGSCFASWIPLLFSLSSIYMGMTPEEALTALTLNGAAALGMAGDRGSIEPGKKADINLLRFPDYRFLVYHTCANIVDTVIKDGEIVHAV